MKNTDTGISSETAMQVSTLKPTFWLYGDLHQFSHTDHVCNIWKKCAKYVDSFAHVDGFSSNTMKVQY